MTERSWHLTLAAAVLGIIVAYVLFFAWEAMAEEVLPLPTQTKAMPCPDGQAARYSIETPPNVEPEAWTDSGPMEVEFHAETPDGTWLWRTTVPTTEDLHSDWYIVRCKCEEVPPSTSTTTTTTNGTATTTTTAGTTTTETTTPSSSTVPPSTASTTPPSTSTSVSTSTAPPTTGETSTLPPPSSSVPPTTPTETLVRTGPREDAIRLAGLGLGLLGLGSVLLVAVRRRYDLASR